MHHTDRPDTKVMSGDDPYDTHLARSFVPVATQSMTEQEAANNLFNVSLTTFQLSLLQQSCGLPVGESPSMGLQQKDTYLCLPNTLSYWSSSLSRSERQGTVGK